VAAVGGAWPEPAPGQRADAASPHQPLDAATAAPMAFRPQGGMHPGRSVSSLMARLETTHVGEQRQDRALRARARQS